MAKNSKVEIGEIELASGLVLPLPKPTPEQINMGFIRKTRHLKDKDKEQEIFWLILETYLSEDELSLWDNISEEEIADAMEAQAKENPVEELKK